MTVVDDRLLESKMTEIEQARAWSPRVISKFETLIRSGDDRSLFRVNPLAFARDRAIAEAEAVDLFLHAARCGPVRHELGRALSRNPAWCSTVSARCAR